MEIAQKFNVTTDYLLGLEEFSRNSEPSLSAEAMRLARDFDTLDEWGQKAVRSVVELELQRGTRPQGRVRMPAKKSGGKTQPLAAHDYTGEPLEVKNSPDLASGAKESGFHD